MPEWSGFRWILRREPGKRVAIIDSEQFLRQGQALFAEAVGEQAIVADAHEAFWQHVEEEAAQELGCLELHDAPPAAMGIIFPAEADVFSVEADQTVVGDGDAVGVAAEITQHLFRATERRSYVDDPPLLLQLFDGRGEHIGILEIRSGAAAVEQSLAVQLRKPFDKPGAEGDAQRWRRHQKQRMRGVYPALMVR